MPLAVVFFLDGEKTKPNFIATRQHRSRARLLARLEREDQHRWSIKNAAIRTLLAFDKTLDVMTDAERERWRAETEMVRAFLKRLQDRGA